jgi:hypothetical protein
MVKIPQSPFKITDVGEDHPLVVDALRPRKHYELCWCGSGRKYKKCHRIRAQEGRLSLGQILDETRRVFWRNRGCMHPHASSSVCQGPVVDSHTIQRKGPLERITSTNNHVSHLEPSSAGETFEVKDIGWKKASTFPGYCGKHDSLIFAQLESTPFSGSHEQCVLQAYRNTCNELYKKRASIESLESQRNLIDRGFSLDDQIGWQLSVNQNIAGQTKSMQEIELLWRKFEDAVIEKKYDRFSSKCYFFEGDLCITSSCALPAEFDFKGNRYADMWDLRENAEMLSHSIMATDKGGAVVFTWLVDERSPQSVVSSFDDIRDEDKGDVFAQYCFLNSENTYFSKKVVGRTEPIIAGTVEEVCGSILLRGWRIRSQPEPLG